jgi:hypothetical protein
VSEWYVLDRLCAADAVFVGEIESELTVRDYVFEYEIWPKELFKGRPDSPGFAISETGGMCGYRLTAGVGPGPGAVYGAGGFSRVSSAKSICRSSR